MKKIFFSLVALAALAACSKSEVEYTDNMELSLAPVTRLNTKAAVDGTDYPDDLNMFVFANAAEPTAALPAGYTEPYFANAEFTTDRDDITLADHVFAGVTPYYWPNVKQLKFAGFSKSGNATGTNASYSVNGDKITITDYTPGEGANDLMYFPATAAYGKDTDFVPVTMYHTCSWITFLVKGDDVTANSTYQVTGLTITGIDNNATVACGTCADVDDVATAVVWGGTTGDNENAKTATLAVTLDDDLDVLTTDAINVETAEEYALADGGNVVVIPQVPGKLTLSYTYESSTGAIITEEVEGIDLKIDANPVVNVWEPGKHYIYTITIKANEILIAPSAGDWTDSNHNITVE